MRISILAVLAVVAGNASAAEYKFVNAHARVVSQARLVKELSAAGFTMVSSACLDGESCSVTVSDKKMADPSKAAASFAAITKKAAGGYDTAVALAAKLSAGTATQAEKDRLLGLLAEIVLSAP